MKHILVFGAGKSSTALIDYFLVHAADNKWQVTVVDASLEAARSKIGKASHGKAITFDIRDNAKRYETIVSADIVISLLPPTLHYLVAKDCLTAKKNLLTASYIDEQIKALQSEIEAAGLLFLCEMGLDPGIDHMSAKKLIDTIQNEGGQITSLYSHCGGLVAPESDDNPWHYKISWNPRNVVMAGKSGAIYKKDGQVIEEDYEALFAERRLVSIPGGEALCWYPNRDSLNYISTYGLPDINTFIRTTLRHPDFMYGWRNIVDLNLTDEEKKYETDGKTLMDFFKQHMDGNDFGEWLQQKMHDQFASAKNLLTELMRLLNLEQEAEEKGIEKPEEFMMVDDKGDLQNIDIDYLKIGAASTLAEKMHDANLILKQLFYLGMNDEETVINKGWCSAADVLQFALEKKLSLQPHDKDMVVMLHEINYTKDGQEYKATSSFMLYGDNAKHTAMAKTVGLPLAIAAQLILNGSLACKGLRIPITKEIYEPVLAGLAQQGIVFREEIIKR